MEIKEFTTEKENNSNLMQITTLDDFIVDMLESVCALTERIDKSLIPHSFPIKDWNPELCIDLFPFDKNYSPSDPTIHIFPIAFWFDNRELVSNHKKIADRYYTTLLDKLMRYSTQIGEKYYDFSNQYFYFKESYNKNIILTCFNILNKTYTTIELNMIKTKIDFSSRYDFHLDYISKKSKQWNKDLYIEDILKCITPIKEYPSHISKYMMDIYNFKYINFKKFTSDLSYTKQTAPFARLV
jgi:hypothetical protein